MSCAGSDGKNAATMLVGLQVVPTFPVRLRTSFANTHYDYIITTILGRHVVFAAATDGTDTLRDSDPVLFTLPARSPLYFMGGVKLGAFAREVRVLTIESVDTAYSLCNAAPLKDAPLEQQALAVWLAHLLAPLTSAPLSRVDLEPWRLRVLNHRQEEATVDTGAAHTQRDSDTNDAVPQVSQVGAPPPVLEDTPRNLQNTRLKRGAAAVGLTVTTPRRTKAARLAAVKK